MKCTHLIKSLGWCQGTPVTPGLKKRVYYILADQILGWPKLPVDERGRPTGARYVGNFVLAEGAKRQYIDHLSSKAEFKSEVQGEVPSQTFKETVTIVHPGIGEEAAEATAALLNAAVIFLVEDMMGDIRVVGCDKWEATATTSRDNGQGPTGTAGTTITLEASDVVDCPYYGGEIVTEDGTINESDGE